MSRCETINRMILETCARRDEEQRQERMDDYVAAGLTPEQILAAEKAYFDKYRFRGRMIGMAISCDFPSGQEFGKSDSESEDEKKAVKEKFEDLRVNT